MEIKEPTTDIRNGKEPVIMTEYDYWKTLQSKIVSIRTYGCIVK